MITGLAGSTDASSGRHRVPFALSFVNDNEVSRVRAAKEWTVLVPCIRSENGWVFVKAMAGGRIFVGRKVPPLLPQDESRRQPRLDTDPSGRSRQTDRRESGTNAAARGETEFRAACDSLVASWIPVASLCDTRSVNVEIQRTCRWVWMSSTGTRIPPCSSNCT